MVVSLWSVNDKATPDLMTKFYEKMLKQSERPGGGTQSRTGRDVASEAMAVPFLLGGVHDAGRVKVR